MKRLRRYVALDVGTKRIGIAVSDPLGLFAQPAGAFSPAEAIRQLVRIHAEDGIRHLIVGWPLTPGGEEGEAVAFVKTFVDQVVRALPDVPWTPVDERYTTQMARRAILEAGARRKARRNKSRVDAASAAIILQSFLDEQER